MSTTSKMTIINKIKDLEEKYEKVCCIVEMKVKLYKALLDNISNLSKSDYDILTILAKDNDINNILSRG